MNETNEVPNGAESEVEHQIPTKSRRMLWVSLAVVAVVLVTSIATYLVLTNKSHEAPTASASPTPKIPSTKEVGQIMTSLDDKISKAASDQAAATAALNKAATPVKVSQ